MDIKGYFKDAQAFFDKDAPAIIRMRGLPYECTAEDILVSWSMVKDALPYTPPDPDEQLITSGTAKNSLRLQGVPLKVQLHQTPSVQQVIPPGTDKNCLILKGLPFKAQIEEIIEFLGEHANNIIPHGLHIVYNEEGKVTGEAFIQMNSAVSAFIAALEKDLKFLTIDRTCRYIQVSQCSGDDISRIMASRQRLSLTSADARIQSPLGSNSPAMSLPRSANASNSSAEFYPVNATASPLPPQQLATPHQDKIWLLNYLQQQQAASQYQQLMQALPKNVPPPPLPPNPSNLWAQNNLTYPSFLPTAPGPFFYIPPAQPQAAAAAGYPQYSAGYPPQYVPQPYFPPLSPQFYFPSIPPNPVMKAPNTALDLKRSWDQAFHSTDVNGNLVKRPAATSTSTVTSQNYANNYMTGYSNTPGFQALM
ncbi:epithelial splicing regulatory protein 2 isoform X2 [Nilaparvata lugens]|uniref:epithelial splicing regulatory protein 2 isoform X2 n=1 Tax=Nilaparvata lugens TaxID=108931 RepID=UPI00193D4486|nr:epithelial splicing regulatory protein 2 isoform X2 [Nilaparvata lugens]